MEKQQAADARDYLTYERAIFYYINTIARLVHRNRRLTDQTGLSSADLRQFVNRLKGP